MFGLEPYVFNLDFLKVEILAQSTNVFRLCNRV